MSQVTITGRIVAAPPQYNSGNFSKQTLIVEVQSGQYQQYYPLDFINADIQSLLPQVQMGGTYAFTCFVNGSSKQIVDRDNNPAAFVNLKVSAVAPSQQAQPQQSQGFGAPQQQPQGFGQPQQTPAAPASQPFGAPQQPQQGFGAPQSAPPAQGGFIGGQGGQQGGFGNQ